MPNGEWYVTRREFDTAIEAADAPPTRRRPPRWSVVARAVAAAVDAPADQVREALAAAIAAERGRARDAGGTPDPRRLKSDGVAPRG